jgi:hypothetical protein
MSYNQGFPENRGSVAGGFGLGIFLNAAQGGLLFLILSLSHRGLTALIVGLGWWGLIQLIYIVPIYIYLRRTKRTDTAKGLLIAAALVLLVNVSCWGRLRLLR